MDMKKEREAFSEWHESAYGEYVTWGNDYPVSHIHNDRWEAWQAAKASAVPDGYTLLPIEPTAKMIDAGMSNFCFPLDNGRFYNHDLIFAYRAMIEVAQEQDQ